MATYFTICDEMTAVEARDVSSGSAVLSFTSSPKVYGDGFVGENIINWHFNDATLAHRIALDIAYRLKERRDELAREADVDALAIAAE